MNNRRHFFAAAGTGMAVAAVGLPAGACIQAAAAVTATPRLTQARFEALLGEDLSVALPGLGASTLRLQAVKSSSADDRLQQFTVVLQRTAGQPLAAGIHELAHARLGRVALRLDPSTGPGQSDLFRADLSVLA